MVLDPQKILNWPFEPVEQTYTERDTILYALGCGLGIDPLDEDQLRFVFEEPELLALPSMAAVLSPPGFWARHPDAGIDWVRILHGEQAMEIHRPLPAAATVAATAKVTDIVDKGPDKGALLFVERTVRDVESGDDLATLRSTTFARGDGGCGGTTETAPAPHSIPDRAPDLACDLPTAPNSALIYRLSGDPNPLHASPSVARAAGFDRPILHGLCSWGVAGHAILKSCCGYDPARIRSMALRFSAPVYPGETIRTEMWRDGNIVSFRARVAERDAVVLNNGRAEIVA
ncbi:MAG: 3-alpha,7-alpha,12-alpha-trihydroxy-5-beta-cholest-24-enoyl-CoA hydratase [Rhodospirillaceae bacterium]|nr:3-alpha,7-alpha,12-alpha-trihydroxy-5-beta-cholest-24-enoyl-CoA hydratase [Rhodospirillaceae bacterium]MYF85653.1 3-alpha,7-alpha,12-alpha-trihydroxy-5-beta-cholest-24-enoyl-CoA hydratase [Rhodospirillaceae bacterium]MYH35939.1 3-alpha,7-alpha,12-alpha-trihydroxy-5-beta-cholest-24-enoyl-CoA hydratase [Rhodospirillaceae bacterium]MYK13974.1 3-alpha,7-alpha,12-alpha-trihydroxy-5-beta-cholest-24-enoyl-CoA hydratase [Rhodospirillaceae bacterium]MYK58955.1 3-alpha,7-alpha,12-alpha-trihydroxy-5-be